MNTLTLGSLFDGSGTAPLAAKETIFGVQSNQRRKEGGGMDKLKPKTVKWPFQRVELYRFIFKPIYDEILQEHIGDGQYHQCERRITCQLIDMEDREMYNEVIKVAHKAGIDDLFLMDKQFVFDALREKLEREGYGRT